MKIIRVEKCIDCPYCREVIYLNARTTFECVRKSGYNTISWADGDIIPSWCPLEDEDES
jgi:hypothetical protein